MVPESVIENVLLQLDRADNIDSKVEAFRLEQPFIAAYLAQEDHRLLTADEYSLLWMIVIAIYDSVEEHRSINHVVSEEQIGKIDEQLWEWLDLESRGTFRSKLDIFFTKSDEEELLAFAEDLLIDDDDNIVTAGGRPMLWIMSCAVVWSLCHPDI